MDLFLLRVGGARAIDLTPDSPADDQQGRISPDGERIAFRSERDKDGIFVMGATGESVRRVTTAGFDPAWSSDGRWLYFSSDRGGTMNIWRVAIDQDGASHGVPQAITSSLTGVASPRFAADGRRLSVMAFSRSFELSLAEIDSGAEVRVRPAAVVRSPSLGWCAPAPQADWLACTGRSGNEDIVLLRPDGSETIRLMDNPARTRHP